MPALQSATMPQSVILTSLTDSSTIGFIASALVLAAFGMKDMVNLRIVAICSNVAFIAYALVLNLPPILILHAILLPLNGWRLAQELRSRRIVQRSSRTYVAVAPDPG
jgi:CRP/FNR family cyclic AMP-dependent transcriptional regulator